MEGKTFSKGGEKEKETSLTNVRIKFYTEHQNGRNLQCQWSFSPNLESLPSSGQDSGNTERYVI